MEDPVCVKSLQSCPTLCDAMDCSLPGYCAHGTLQARILEWVAVPSPGDLPDPEIEPASFTSPASAEGSLSPAPPGMLLLLLLSHFSHV